MNYNLDQKSTEGPTHLNIIVNVVPFAGLIIVNWHSISDILQGSNRAKSQQTRQC